MPCYEYECKYCGNTFELRRSFDDTKAVECPVCHGEARQHFSPVSVIYKGPGFYTTDNRRNGTNPKASCAASCS